MDELVSQENLGFAVKYLAANDADLALLLDRDGLPPLWQREPSFGTLVHIILEQQVSLASARAAFRRLERAIRVVTPHRLLALSDEEMKSIGFSRQKIRYARIAAESIINGELNLTELHDMDDESARDRLMGLKGVGKWTADIYILMALRRRDAWPEGDLALSTAVHAVKRLSARPSPADLIRLAEPWRPWRAVAARILWNHYLLRLRPASGTT